MHPVNRAEVERLAEGDIASAEDTRRIEHAFENDPQVAQWYGEIQAALAPSPAAREALHAEVQRLVQSNYVRLRWHSPLPDECESGQAHEAIVELPSGEQACLVFRASESVLTIECKSLPTSLQPVSVALFTPQRTELALFERPAPVGGADGLLDVACRTSQALAAEDAQELAAETARPLAAETPLAMACDSGDRKSWATPPISSHGGKVWVEDTAAGVAVRCQFPQGAAPEGLKFRFAWEDVESGLAHHREEAIRLGMPKNQIRYGEGLLRVDLARFQRAHRAGKLDLKVLVPSAPPSSLAAAAFRDIVGDDFQALILDSVEGASSPTFQAQFRNDEQRRLWADSAACRMVRFENV